MGFLFISRAKELGAVLIDQIDKPLDRAVWWIEHIMRHPTLYSGRSPVHKLAWYQYLLLDVFTLYATIAALLGLIFYKIVYCCCGSKRKAEKTANQKMLKKKN
jgi:glucuronosyltransferase